MNEENREQKSKKKIIILIAAIVLILVAALLVLYFRSKISATTMRILRIEGEVTLEDEGKPKTITNNLRLNSGNALSTAIKSLVSIGLDDTKIVTLDEKSRAEFYQSGRKLNLDLTAGSLFFEVSKSLESDESFDISTSTMVVGIRGTSGWVSVEGEHESLIISDGVVHVVGKNPVTGEVKEIDVKAGQRITVYLYNDRTVDSIEFFLEEVTERDLPEFMLDRLRENRELLDKVCSETGWDKPWILGHKESDMPEVIVEDDTHKNDNDKTPDTGSDIDDLTDEIPEDTEEEPTKGASDKDRAEARARVVFIDPETGIRALDDGTLFDPAFYAEDNPDVVDEYGTDPDSLLSHWLKHGKKEGRPPIRPIKPTPTIIPQWVEEPAPAEEEHHSNQSSQNAQKSSTNSTNGTVSINPSNNNQGTVSFGSGAGATANYTASNIPGQRGTWNLNVNSPDKGNNTTVTLPTSFKAYDRSTNTDYDYGISIGPNDSNISLDFNNTAMQNVKKLDLSAATSVTGGNVYGRDMVGFMNQTNNSQLEELVGPASTLKRNQNNPSEYTAVVKAGDTASSYKQSLNDGHDYINNMPGNGITSTTYPADSNSTQGLSVTTETGANNNTYSKTVLKDNNNNDKTYYDIQVDGPINWSQSSYKVYGNTQQGDNSTRTEIGTVTNAGFTPK